MKNASTQIISQELKLNLQTIITSNPHYAERFFDEHLAQQKSERINLRMSLIFSFVEKILPVFLRFLLWLFLLRM